MNNKTIWGFCMFPCQNYLARFNGSNLSLAASLVGRSTPNCHSCRFIATWQMSVCGCKDTIFFWIYK